MKMMNNKYPLEWLDALVVQHFNPGKTDLSRLSDIDLALIAEHVQKEASRIEVRIKDEMFTLRKKRQIRLQVRKYHSNLIFLLDTIVENHKNKLLQLPLLSRTAQVIIKCLDDLLSFLEGRFAAYLSLDERVPVTYAMVSRNELQLKLKNLGKVKMDSAGEQLVSKLVLEELAAALKGTNNCRVTFRQLSYERRLLKEMEEFGGRDDQEGVFYGLDHKLIGLNFNSPLYAELLIKRIAEKIGIKEVISEKLSLLSYYRKEFSQIYCDEKMFFNAGTLSLRKVLENWFGHEIQYLEKQVGFSGICGSGLAAGDKAESKLECDLSADQIGIILRAADEARVVKSRSLSFVFQRIVPHLSTAFKKDLSYQSVRSKSYNAEENDKNIAILTLEKMIRKIRTY